MKTHLLFLKRQFTVLILLLLSVLFYGQVLVSYSFSNNLNPDATPPTGLNPVLQYFDPPNPNPIIPTDYSFGYLNFANNGDYAQLTFDATNFDGLTAQFTGGIGVFFAIANGNIKVYLQLGNNAETQIAAGNIAAYFIGIDTINFSIPIATADNQPQVKIRIVGTSSTFGLFTFFGIDNLALVRNTTTITVRNTATNPVYPLIPYDAAASTTLNTDFGSHFTNQDFADKTYRITNTGTKDLSIKKLAIVPDDAGFIFLGPVPTVINAGQNATFTVRFAPVNQGVQSAEILIEGNIVPENPFRFEVKGSGKSCNLIPVPIARYGFEGTPPTNMPVTFTAGSPKYVGNVSDQPLPNNFGGRLYHRNNDAVTSLYAADSPTNSLYARGNDTNLITLEFGPVDITNQQEVSINFDVAAFGLTNKTNSGVNNGDYVILSVFNSATSTWSDEIILSGSNNSTKRKYAYGAPAIAASNFDGVLVSISNNNIKTWGKFVLNLPPSANISNLLFRITAQTVSNSDLWLIDNVHVDAGNAKYKTWTGTGWFGENTIRPGSREKAVFASDYDFVAAGETTDLSICECEIKSNASVLIPAGKALTVRNRIINNGTETNLIVQSDANLLQTENGAQNTGNATVKRHAQLKRLDYNYWASPVADQNLKAFSPGTLNNRFYTYNESNDLFDVINPVTNNFANNGKGYAIRAFNTYTTAPQTFVGNFIGEPNNGIKVLTLDFTNSLRGYNLIGNPYPSNLNFYSLYANNSDLIYNTAYFWTNINPNPEMQGNGYPADGALNNYAILNGTGGVNATGSSPADGSTFVPNEFIKVGQGFIVKAKKMGNLTFQNNLRTLNNSGHFYNKSTETTVDRFWLQLTTPLNVATTQLIGYKAEATNDFELDYDAPLLVLGADAFYSVLGDEKLAIQGKAPFVTTDIVQLGSSHYEAGNYTISLGNKEGIFSTGQNVYLKDVQTGIITNLSEGPYTFAATKGVTEGRFEIFYKQPENVLAREEISTEELVIYRIADDFIVRAVTKKITAIEVYDLAGRLVYSMAPNHTKAVVPADYLVSGVYLLKIFQGEKVSSRKIIK